MAAPRSSRIKSSHPCQASPGRMLIPDPEGDVVLFPCAPVPQRFRVATDKEIAFWWAGTEQGMIELGHVVTAEKVLDETTPEVRGLKVDVPKQIRPSQRAARKSQPQRASVTGSLANSLTGSLTSSVSGVAS